MTYATFVEVLVTCPVCGHEWEPEVLALQGAEIAPVNNQACPQCEASINIRATVSVSVEVQS